MNQQANRSLRCSDFLTWTWISG